MIKINGLRDDEVALYAEALLGNPVFNAILYEFRAGAIGSWEATLPEQTDLREKAWMEYRTVQAFHKFIQDILTEAKLAAADNEQEQMNG